MSTKSETREELGTPTFITRFDGVRVSTADYKHFATGGD
jgi:hypothetical protein